MRYKRSTAVFGVGVLVGLIGLVLQLTFGRAVGLSNFETAVPILILAWILERKSGRS